MTTTTPTTPTLDPFGMPVNPADLAETLSSEDTPANFDCWAWLDELSPEEREEFERYAHAQDSE